MRVVRFGAALAALVLSAHVLTAQQPGAPQQTDRRHGGKSGMAAQMQLMDSLNARLDTLVSQMNRATGNGKVTAMAAVINELVAQRKAMHGHMRQMMESRDGMMGTMEEPAAGEHRPPTGADSTPADSAGHAGHHPPS